MRPDYEPAEIDQRCDVVVSGFLQRKYGGNAVSLQTPDLRSLLELETERLDLSADFANDSSDVEVVTEFKRGHKPVVKIAAKLTQDRSLEDRLRAALAHAYGHVHLHNFLFQTEEALWLSFFEGSLASPVRIHRCSRDAIVHLREEDWMEWQAAYACGAILMPVTGLIPLVREFRHQRDLDHAALSDHSLDSAALVRDVAERFQTSWNLARNRLVQREILSAPDMRSLF